MSNVALKKNIVSKSKSSFEFDFCGKKIIFEVDQLASKSDKSIICHYGNTTVLTVLTIKKLTKEIITSFFPLTVTLEERFYAIGRIPNVFDKREGKPSYDAITVARLIDRSLRSFFPKSTNHEVQINNLILSSDKNYDPRICAIWNSFLVCFLSLDLPYFCTPMGAVIVSKENSNFICNPSSEKISSSSLEVLVSATEKKIIALEAKALEINEQELEKAISFSQIKIKTLIRFFQQIAIELGVNKVKQLSAKKDTAHKQKNEDSQVKKKMRKQLEEIFLSPSTSWIEKEKKAKEIRQEWNNFYCQGNPSTEDKYIKNLTEEIWDECIKNLMRRIWKKNRTRLDGRKPNEIRPIKTKIDYLPSTHGSAIFSRGETNVLSVVTVGKTSEKQLIDNVFSRSYKHFIHHYNFPSFSVNEIASNRSVSRREIGHGELVEKTFEYLVPSSKTFPYTIRAVSEVLSSDGSSSQASICASSLALMAAGVPLVSPVAGIALGLFERQIYSDINGLEDKLGEMDFKVAGTEKGICSLQLDVKNQGISKKVLKESLEKACQVRLYLLEEMKKCISRPRSVLHNQVTKCQRFYIGNEKTGLIIGSRGKTINKITEETGVNIEIQSDGYILIYYQEEAILEKTLYLIKKILGSER